MSETAPETPPETEPTAELSFDRAAYAASPASPASPTPNASTPVPCATCKRPLGEQYWKWQRHVMCAGCREELARTLAKSQSGAALGKAFLMGGAAALGCGVAYAIFEAVVDYQLAIITIGIAIVIATVIRKASGGISGLRFQILAVALTYFASAMGYAPAVWKGLTSAESHHAATSDASVHPVGSPAASAHADAHAGADAHAAAAPNANPDAKTPFSPFKFLLAIALFVAFTLAAPFFTITEAPIGALIIAIGLWQAWQRSRGVPTLIEGPFRVAPPAPAPTPSPAAG